MALRSEFPVIEGRYQMTPGWQVTLPGPFNYRFENNALVMWRPGFTIWANVWNNDQAETLDEILERIKGDSSPEAYDTRVEREAGLIRYSYRLKEDLDDGRQPALYCFAIGNKGHVQMAIYFDDAQELAVAEKVWRSLRENPR